LEFHKDTEADRKIRLCIDNCQNFIVIAGAGSGKTGSLIKALVYIRQKYGEALRVAGQQVVCITYTNAAVDVIKQRTNVDNLFFISTIHSFLWGLVERYQTDIRVILKEDLIPQRIGKQKKKDNGGKSKRAIKARKQIAKLSQDIEYLSEVKQFRYGDGSRRDYSVGLLDHNDVIDLASIMISKSPVLQKIIGQKFPYIFIDEAQDTFLNVMESLNLVAQLEGLPIIGYFGDPMQQIYSDNRAGEFRGPEGAVEITKRENYRCSTEVIKLLNVIRPKLQQIPGDKNVTGSVEMRLIQAEVGSGSRRTYSVEQLSRALEKFDNALVDFGWAGSVDVRQLFLTWQMIAHRLGFSKLNHLFSGRYASRAAEDAFRKGEHFVLQPFVDVLVPLMEANIKHDQIAMTRIMRQYSPILDPIINKSASVKEVKDKVQVAIDALSTVWNTASIREVLAVACEYNLIVISECLAEQLDRHRRVEAYDDSIHSQEKSDWLIDEYLTYKTEELAPYRNFILESTPFSTQHGVKGEEYEKVLVVFDDTEAAWNNFSFSRLLTPNTVGTEATKGQRKRSLNLAYVCFSRTVRDLRIILFTLDPLTAKQELVEKGLFAGDQISI
jgi:DNA helicase II / ATP-dependent DNA helicase PcrA